MIDLVSMLYDFRVMIAQIYHVPCHSDDLLPSFSAYLNIYHEMFGNTNAMITPKLLGDFMSEFNTRYDHIIDLRLEKERQIFKQLQKEKVRKMFGIIFIVCIWIFFCLCVM